MISESKIWPSIPKIGDFGAVDGSKAAERWAIAMEQARLPCRRRDGNIGCLAMTTRYCKGGDANVRNVPAVAANRRPSILSRHHRRPRLRFRHRQGAAVDHGRVSAIIEPLCASSASRFDAGCRRADLLACVAERAGQARDDRARVLRPRRVHAARTGMPARSPPISPRAKSARNWRAVRSRRSGSGSRSSSRPAPCIWSRPMPA